MIAAYFATTTCSFIELWYIKSDEGDARGARPVSVRRDWFFIARIVVF